MFNLSCLAVLRKGSKPFERQFCTFGHFKIQIIINPKIYTQTLTFNISVCTKLKCLGAKF